MSSFIAGWGRLGVSGTEVQSEDLLSLTECKVLSRGLGRSYGDASLPPPSSPIVAGTVRADRILAFDPVHGDLRAEAGLSLAELNRLFWPRGYCSPTLPGTQFITLGGMVAADVHAKNHHRDGCFGEHVQALKMRLADGRIITCGPSQHTDLFRATIGGMGLTGHILEVSFRLKRIPTSWIWQESRRIDNIDDYITALKSSANDWPYTVGWIDCISTNKTKMGRGILLCGRWAEVHEAPPTPPHAKLKLVVPIDFPNWALGRHTVQAFNFGYYWKHLPRMQQGITHPDTFFHPLDAILHWNRIYGRRGFTQYQCVLPAAAGPGAARRFLELLTQLGGASFLCVIKDCGAQGTGLLSFPMPGISIALDIAVRDNTQALVDRLNEHLIAEGGRIYLAKDMFTRAEHYRAMEPRLDEWLQIRRKWDPRLRFRSALSVRLFGDPP